MTATNTVTATPDTVTGEDPVVAPSTVATENLAISTSLEWTDYKHPFQQLVRLPVGPSMEPGMDFATFGTRAARLVPWKREPLHKSRSAAPGGQGATTENIEHI